MLTHQDIEDSNCHGRSEMHQDLEHAKNEFMQRNLGFIIVSDSRILAESKEKGVAPFYFAVAKNVKGGSVADKIVGKAVAFLCAYSGVVSVYTPVISQPALDVLNDYTIHVEVDKVVPMILNREKNGQCPIEALIMECTTPEEAYTVLKKKFEG